MFRKILCGAGALGTSLFASAAYAADLVKAPLPEVQATMVDKGDTAWMLVASVLVLMMSVPALALFYGGLVRSKNMLSVLMQVFMIVSIAALVWVGWGYTMSFTSSGSAYPAIFGGFDKAFLAGVSASTYAATFSNNVYLPEYVFVIFQMTFACITPALIVGAFAERVKFWPLMLFMVLWLTAVYFPIAHMVWYWAGPDFLADTVVKDAAGALVSQDAGLLWGMGALDFAGGTVVHINAAVAGLVGAFMVGKRIGYGREPMAPHNMVMTMIGGSLLWVGWFGFNAGSALEASGTATLAFINTLDAAAAAALTWTLAERLLKGKPSVLGAISGAVAGLVAITPACGWVGVGGGLVIGALAGFACFWGRVGSEAERPQRTAEGFAVGVAGGSDRRTQRGNQAATQTASGRAKASAPRHRRVAVTHGVPRKPGTYG